MEQLLDQLVTEMRHNIRSHTRSDDENAVSYKMLKDKRACTVRFCDTPVFRIRRLKSSFRIEVRAEFISDFELNDLVKPSREPGWTQAEYSQSVADRMTNAAYKVYEKCGVTERIGCCSEYLECSDARKCVKPDVPWARGCWYRENLNKGKVFYGKNRNQD